MRAFGPRDVQRHHRCLAGVSRAVYSVQCTVCSYASWTHYYPTLSILLSILLDFLVAMNLLSRKTCARPPPRCLCIPHLSLAALPPSSTSVPILYSSTMSVTRDGCFGRGTHSSRRLRSTSEFPSWLQMSLITEQIGPRSLSLVSPSPGHLVTIRPAHAEFPTHAFAMSASRAMSAAVVGTSRATPAVIRVARGSASPASRRRAPASDGSRNLLHASAGTSVDFDKFLSEGSETSALSIICAVGRRTSP